MTEFANKTAKGLIRMRSITLFVYLIMDQNNIWKYIENLKRQVISCEIYETIRVLASFINFIRDDHDSKIMFVV